MAKFGRTQTYSGKARNKESAIVDSSLYVSLNENTPIEQQIADTTITNLALAKDKNARVMDVSAAMAEEQSNVYIEVPPSDIDNSQDTYMVRNALIRNYRAESENGTVIRFPLFKKIVDNAAATQEKLLIDVIQLGEFNSGVNQFSIGDLYSVLNAPRGSSVFKEDKSSSNETDDRALWITLGVAFLSYTLMGKLNKLKWLHAGDDEVKDVNAEDAADNATGGDAATAANVASRKAQRRIKIVQILLKIAEAVILFALIHGLKKKQTEQLAQQVMPQSIDQELKEEFTKMVSTMYDNPPSDISVMVQGQDDSDEHIIEYCMRRIDAEKDRKRFTPWIVYSIAKIRDLNINDLSRSLSATSNEPDRIQKIIVDKQLATAYKAPTFTTTEQVVRDTQTGTVFPYTTPPSTLSAGLASGSVSTRFSFKNPLDKYLPGGPGKPIGFDINNYISSTDDFANQASTTSDYYMGLLTNNKYTPELVCCLLKFLGDDLDFLKSLRNMLDVFQKGVGIRLGDLLQDIVDGLFNDIKNRLLTYAITELSKLMAKAKQPILAWIDKVTKENEYVAFCTPILDMAYALLGILNEFEELLRAMLKEIMDALLTFELKFDNDVIKLNGTNRYVNIIAILDAIIYALEHGRLCNQSALQPSDIHPDAFPIIASEGSVPPVYLSKAIDEHKAFNEAVRNGISSEKNAMVTVMPFKDPEDPKAKGAVSMTRRDTGETLMETIANYAPKCGAFNGTTAFNFGVS